MKPIDEQTMDETDAKPEESLNPETFELEKWIAGVQPVKRAVTVYARPDLIAEMDVLGEHLRIAEHAGHATAAAKYRSDIQALADSINSSTLDIVAEAWSPDRVRTFRKDAQERGLEEDDINLAQIAAQIVSPSGLTPESVKDLLDRLSSQAQKVVNLVALVNSSQAAEVTIPF